jgi:hypothetical protein
VRSCKPDPLAADIVHVAEDRRNGADVVFVGVFAGRFGCRFGSPGGRVKMFDRIWFMRSLAAKIWTAARPS